MNDKFVILAPVIGGGWSVSICSGRYVPLGGKQFSTWAEAKAAATALKCSTGSGLVLFPARHYGRAVRVS